METFQLLDPFSCSLLLIIKIPQAVVDPTLSLQRFFEDFDTVL